MVDLKLSPGSSVGCRKREDTCRIGDRCAWSLVAALEARRYMQDFAPRKQMQPRISWSKGKVTRRTRCRNKLESVAGFRINLHARRRVVTDLHPTRSD